jgi:hypothetical protein
MSKKNTKILITFKKQYQAKVGELIANEREFMSINSLDVSYSTHDDHHLEQKIEMANLVLYFYETNKNLALFQNSILFAKKNETPIFGIPHDDLNFKHDFESDDNHLIFPSLRSSINFYLLMRFKICS